MLKILVILLCGVRAIPYNECFKLTQYYDLGLNLAPDNMSTSDIILSKQREAAWRVNQADVCIDSKTSFITTLQLHVKQTPFATATNQTPFDLVKHTFNPSTSPICNTVSLPD